MLLPLIMLIAGILISAAGVGMGFGIVLMCIGMALAWVFGRRSKSPVAQYKKRNLHYIWPPLILLGLGIIRGDIARPFRVTDDDFSRYSAARVHIRDVSQRTTGNRILGDVIALVGEQGAGIRCRNFPLIIYSDEFPFDVDDVIDIGCGFERLKDSHANADSRYIADMEHKGIFYFKDLSDGEATYVTRKVTPRGISASLRTSCIRTIEHCALSRDTRAFLIAVLLGEKAYLRDETRGLFSDAGVSHMLALSGMHVGIITGIFLFLLFPLNFKGLYRWRLAIATLLIWFYAFLSGMGPSIMRACVMTTIAVVSILMERKGNAFNSLCTAAFIIIFISPSDIYDIGMQLSCLCVAGLIAFASAFNTIDRKAHPHLYSIIALILASLTATFSSWILMAWYIHKVPLMFLPANIIALPLLPSYIVISIILICLTSIGIPAGWLAQTVDYVFSLFTTMLDYVSQGSGMSVSYRPSMLSVCLWFLSLSLLAIWLHRRHKRDIVILASLSFICAFVSLGVTREQIQEGYQIKGYENIEIAVSASGIDSVITSQRHSVCIHEIYGHTIVAVDCGKENIEKIIPKLSENLKVVSKSDRMVLIGSNYDGDIPLINEAFHPSQIIIHRSVRRKRESRLIHQSDSLHLPVHSLRLDGPWRGDLYPP